ncbi:MAG: GGDEF domain-containing protein [Actinomycetota bacterium]
MGLVMAGLFFAGATIGALSLLLPHPAEFDDGALWTNVALAYAGAGVLFAARRHLPAWSLQFAVLAGTLVVTRAVYYGNDPSGFYTFWYIWVGVFAFFFFGRAWGAVHLAVMAGAYAWVLAVLPDTTPVARGLLTIGSVAVCGSLVDTLARHLREEKAASAARAGNLEAVGEVAHQLAIQSDPGEVGRTICSAAVETACATAAVLWRPTSSGSELVATAAAGAPVEGRRLPFVTPDSGAVQAFTGAHSHSKVGEEQPPSQELAPDLVPGTAYWQPILREEVAVGVLAVYWQDAHEEVEAETEQTIRLLALEAALAIERGELLGRLEKAARTDDLTGLLNRRAWDAELGRELARSTRRGHALCVAMLDLDRFKEYNDAHGHQAGDRYLKQAAGTWSEMLRSTDVLARYGGEEFALAMPATDLASAKAILERLRAAVPGGSTTSAGVCIWDREESAEALLARADAVLYQAKAAGRDKVFAA